jgi:hypothetical protein
MLIKVTICGLTPLMMDRFSNDMLETQTPKTTNSKTELTPLQQAEKRLYRYKDGTPYLPAVYLFRAVIDAGRFIKIGKRQLSTRDDTIVTSFMSLVGTDYPIQSKEGWRVDARGIVNQTTKGRVMAYRPIFDDWQIDFTIDLDTAEGKISTARELVDKSGQSDWNWRHAPVEKRWVWAIQSDSLGHRRRRDARSCRVTRIKQTTPHRATACQPWPRLSPAPLARVNRTTPHQTTRSLHRDRVT